MKRVLRIDANRRMGFGHAVRVAALCGQLTPAQTIVCGELDETERFFPGATQVPAPADALECATLIASMNADLLVCDSPLLRPDFWSHAKALVAAPVVAIDDFGGPVMADCIVNGTVLPRYHDYPAADASALRLCGARYALLRPCFAENHWSDPPERRLTVVAGSGERAARWMRRVHDAGVLRGNQNCPTTLVVGWGFAEPPLLDEIRSSGVDVNVGLGGEALAALLAKTTVLLATGGMIVYEALAVGVPSVVYPQEDDMHAEARWFASHGGIVNLGPGDGGAPQQVQAAIASLWDSPRERRALSLRGAALVDGRGAQRVADALGRWISEMAAR